MFVSRQAYQDLCDISAQYQKDVQRLERELSIAKRTIDRLRQSEEVEQGSPIIIEELYDENHLDAVDVIIQKRHSDYSETGIRFLLTSRECHSLRQTDEWKALLKRLEDI